jgi:hypothetical protein
MSSKVVTGSKLKLSPELSYAIKGLLPEEWAKEEASYLLQKSHQAPPPVDLKTILPLRKIETKVTSQNQLNCSARLVPCQNKFKVVVRTARNENPITKKRRRFTIAHEIGHTYFFNLDHEPLIRLPGLERYSLTEERLCDMFASSLLMPEEALLKKYYSYNKKTHFLCILHELHNEFDVSYGAMALRLIKQLKLWKGVLFTCQWLPKEVNWGVGVDKNVGSLQNQSWRLYWSVIPDELSNKLYIPKPTKFRNYTPSIKWNCIEQLAQELNFYEIKEFSITNIEAGRFSNFRKVLTSYIGEQSIFTGWATAIPRFWLNKKQKSSQNPKREMTIVLAFDM